MSTVYLDDVDDVLSVDHGQPDSLWFYSPSIVPANPLQLQVGHNDINLVLYHKVGTSLGQKGVVQLYLTNPMLHTAVVDDLDRLRLRSPDQATVPESDFAGPAETFTINQAVTVDLTAAQLHLTTAAWSARNPGPPLSNPAVLSAQPGSPESVPRHLRGTRGPAQPHGGTRNRRRLARVASRRRHRRRLGWYAGPPAAGAGPRRMGDLRLRDRDEQFRVGARDHRGRSGAPHRRREQGLRADPGRCGHYSPDRHGTGAVRIAYEGKRYPIGSGLPITLEAGVIAQVGVRVKLGRLSSEKGEGHLVRVYQHSDSGSEGGAAIIFYRAI